MLGNEHEEDDIVDVEPEMTDTTDDVDLEDIEENKDAKIKKLRTKLAAAEKEKMQHLEDLQRAKAEFLNIRKRMEEERVRDKERAIETQIEKLLPLCDSFDMAMSNTEAWEAIDANWRSGVEGIHSQLVGILDSYGVTAIKPLEATFDPNQHEAVGTADTDKPTDTVVEVLQSGYERNGEIIRAAKVVLSS